MTCLKSIKLKELLIEPIRNGYSPICVEKPTGMWVLGLGALTNNGLDIQAVKAIPAHSFKKQFLLNKGDFLVSRSNTLDKVGRSILYRGEIQSCTYPDLMMKFRINDKKIYPEFLESFLKSDYAVKYFQSCAAGTSGTMVKITKSVLEHLEVPVFEFGQQQKIAAILKTWDEVVNLVEKLIVIKEKKLRSLYQFYFKPDSKFNEKWQRHKIKHFLKMRKEKAIPTPEVPLYSLTIEDGVTAKTDRYNREFLVKNTQGKEYKVVYPKDIVFNPANIRWGAIARSEISHKVALSPIYEVLEVAEDKVNSDFLTHLLTCPRQIGIYAAKTEGTLVERMAVKLDAFLLMEIYIPEDKRIQAEIANILNMAKKELLLIKKLLEKMMKQKHGLMQQLLSGKRRVYL